MPRCLVNKLIFSLYLSFTHLKIPMKYTGPVINLSLLMVGCLGTFVAVATF